MEHVRGRGYKHGGRSQSRRPFCQPRDLGSMNPGVLTAPWRKRQTGAQRPSAALWHCFLLSFTSFLGLAPPWGLVTEPKTNAISP